jgi:Spy/CpxP family protein refolding chaperone
LTQELSLTADQQKQVEAIIASVQSQYKAIRESTEPQLNEARQRGREQMRAVLTPGQRPKFEDFLRRLDEERRKNAPK